MKRNILPILLLIAVAFLMPGCATGVHPPRGAGKPIVRDMLTTGYCKCGKCCNWKRNWYFKPVVAHGSSAGKAKKVGKTASGKKAKAGQTIAADTKKYPLGTIMYIPDYGYGRVEDRGSAIKGEHIDLYFKTHKQALHWGRRNKEVKVWLP